jgi:hypothetical protein
MKRLLCLLVLSVGLAGCGPSASQSEFWKHDTMYRSWDHMRFSWGGYQSVTTDEVKTSVEEDWWGKPVPVTPVAPVK